MEAQRAQAGVAPGAGLAPAQEEPEGQGVEEGAQRAGEADRPLLGVGKRTGREHVAPVEAEAELGDRSPEEPHGRGVPQFVNEDAGGHGDVEGGPLCPRFLPGRERFLAQFVSPPPSFLREA